MRLRYIAGVLLVLTAGLLLAQENTTNDSKEKPAEHKKDHSVTMVGTAPQHHEGAAFYSTAGKTWGVSNPEILKDHRGRVVEITGTIDAQRDSIHINKVSDIACGPRLCERQCKGKCGNGSACDCPTK